MSERIKSILSILTCLIILSGCQNEMIPAGYLPKPKEISKTITGSWIKVSMRLDSLQESKIDLSGELIAIQNDTLYFLSEAGFISLHKRRINSINLYFFARPKSPFLGFLFLIPNVIGALSYGDVGPYFLLIGIPISLTSILMEGVERSDGNAILDYPKENTLDEFSKYARFPQGLPPKLDKEKLHLIIN
jgi:hypothetical protein